MSLSHEFIGKRFGSSCTIEDKALDNRHIRVVDLTFLNNLNKQTNPQLLILLFFAITVVIV